jgi:hypothetical protein
MLQLVSRALTDDAFALDGPAKKPGHREWLAIAVVAMAAFAQTGFARGCTPAGYFAPRSRRIWSDQAGLSRSGDAFRAWDIIAPAPAGHA